MYYLFVAGTGWEPARDEISVGRVLEHTDQDLIDLYKPGRLLNVEGLPLDIPAVFMSETGNQEDQLARIGEVTRFRRAGTDLQFDYVLDPSIAPLTNAQMEELAGQLGIDRWEFSRTHVALKKRDLFKVLLARQHGTKLSPKVFRLPECATEDDLVSVMMPFGAAFTPVYQTLTDAITALGLRVHRADDIWNHDAIIQDVVSLITLSSVVVCDLSGKNANVFYEAGIAHTLGKDVILVTQSADDVPFDLRHLRHVQYHNNGEGRLALGQAVAQKVRALTGT